MARGDEIEEGGWPRARPSPPRVYDDDQYYARGGDHEPADIRIDRPQRSGLVASVGIVGIILGSLGLVCGVCGGVGGAVIAGFGPIMQKELENQGQFDNDAAQAAKELEKMQSAAWLVFAESLSNVVVGAAMLLASIGVLARSNLARYALLGITATSVVIEVTDIAVKVVMDLFDGPGDAATDGVSLVLMVGFAFFAWIVLLIPRFAAEFYKR